MSMDEPTARRLVLAYAIETADSQGKLLTEQERAQIDREARQAAGVGGEGAEPIAPEHFLDVRARQVLGAIGGRHPALFALQEPRSWQRWLLWLAPAVAVVLGVLTDVIANPHRVDLVSLPLLGLVAWNLAIYVVLIGGRLFAGGAAHRPLLAGLGRWTDGERAMRRGTGNLRANVTALFHLRWYAFTEALHVQRIKRVLHLSAAGWAVGVALSLLARGLVVEYRVGWESTFLDAQQVHAILSALRLPALLLFPFQPFSVQEVAALQFSQGGGAVAGARWVYMYVALLLVLVVVPRLVLAAMARWHEWGLARNVALDLSEPYFRRLLSLLSSDRVGLCLVTHRSEDRDALLRVLAQESDAGRTLMRSAQDDVLRWVDLSGAKVPAGAPPAPSTEPGNWFQRVIAVFREGVGHPDPVVADPALTAARNESDLAIYVVGAEHDLAAAHPLLRWLNKPVLVIAHPPIAGDAATDLLTQCESEARRLAVPAAVLPFEAFAGCWVQETALLAAIGRLLPESKQAGFARIRLAWEERSSARLVRAMGAVADHLLFAARQVEEVHSDALSVRSLVPAQRTVEAQARQQAIDRVVQRLDASAAELFARLRKLHGIEEVAAGALQHRMEEKFVVQRPVHTPQAGMAGAATGAAMGASVDLLVGGLTLGAATALGALVGGSAAFIAAAWKNRSTSSGSTVVQLSDEMMQAMVEAALLRYLAVAHYGRGAADASGELRPYWKSEVVAAVEARKAMLTPVWTAARTQPDAGRLALALARELETLARQVLAALHRAPAMQAPKTAAA
jgi:hypothetical protein